MIARAEMTEGECSGAFVPGEVFDIAPTGAGRLSGTRFAVKDLIDVAGSRTGGGNPDWRAAASVAQAHAGAVEALLAAGACLIGKTITDELAFSLEGENEHYGAPRNPRNPDWLPGGSSSGSAVAVAGGACDFALGTDTGGSVRVPAAFCGIFGFRPSHDAISMHGVLPFAPSLDTLGWFARDAMTLQAVGDVLLPVAESATIMEIRLCSDALDHVGEDVARAMLMAAEEFATAEPVRLFEALSLDEVSECYRVVQGYEIAQALGWRLRQVEPRFAQTIAARFASVWEISEDAYHSALAQRERLAGDLMERCPAGVATILPVSPVAFLSKGAPGDALGEFYRVALGLNALAGLSGRPQVQLGSGGTGPAMACSLMGWRGGDRALLDVACSLSRPQ